MLPEIIRIGVLSDTHLNGLSEAFKARAAVCFSSVSIILHAGDLTDISILQAFNGKEVHAVHGNMCRHSSCAVLPARKILTVGPFKIGLIHKAGYSYDFEGLLPGEFDEPVDCIVYGHTHLPTCHKTGGILYFNPGSFNSTGRHGAPGTFGILEAGDNMTGKIYQVPEKV